MTIYSKILTTCSGVVVHANAAASTSLINKTEQFTPDFHKTSTIFVQLSVQKVRYP